MKKITKQASDALVAGRVFKGNNTECDGKNLYLFGNKIARVSENGVLYITNSGYSTATTKERLNALPFVNIRQRNFTWYLANTAEDGEYREWDGSWIKIGKIR